LAFKLRHQFKNNDARQQRKFKNVICQGESDTYFGKILAEVHKRHNNTSVV